MQPQFVLRLATALVAAPLMLGAAWLGGLWWTALISAASGIGAWELYRLARADGIVPIAWLGLPMSAVVPFLVYAAYTNRFVVPVSAAALGLLLVLGAMLLTRSTAERPLASAGITVLGVLYTAGTLSFGYALRYHPYVVGAAAGTALLGLPVWLTWSTDTGAYLFGRIFGGPKLMPSVSPGKTISGAVGGLLAAVFMSWAYVHYVLQPVAEVSMTLVGAIVFAVLISLAGQVGDLFESLLKREAGVKDSSGVFPGHGGVLDRLDSLCFVLPLAYLLLPWFLVAAPLGTP